MYRKHETYFKIFVAVHFRNNTENFGNYTWKSKDQIVKVEETKQLSNMNT